MSHTYVENKNFAHNILPLILNIFFFMFHRIFHAKLTARHLVHSWGLGAKLSASQLLYSYMNLNIFTFNIFLLDHVSSTLQVLEFALQNASNQYLGKGYFTYAS